jgi:hypothetical protein
MRRNATETAESKRVILSEAKDLASNTLSARSFASLRVTKVAAQIATSGNQAVLGT